MYFNAIREIKFSRKFSNLQYSEDPVEMLHHVAFQQGLHCMLRQRLSSEKEMQFIWNVSPVTPYYIQ